MPTFLRDSCVRYLSACVRGSLLQCVAAKGAAGRKRAGTDVQTCAYVGLVGALVSIALVPAVSPSRITAVPLERWLRRGLPRG
jgi:hypothetical protein